MRPESLVELIRSLNALPGITKKQSERLAYQLVKTNRDEAKELVDAINGAESIIKDCSICGFITDKKICDICADEDKNRKKILVVVETSLDVLKFEEAGTIKPFYHVLNGLINVSKDIAFEDLNVSTLTSRAQKFSEIIIALSPNLEGIVTANIIKNLLKGKKVTQLAQGIPLGAAMEYVDELTLKIALDNRKEVK